MKIKYKQVEITKPHCGECGERLEGNGSIARPYKCSCGEWIYDLEKGEHKLTNPEQENKGRA